MVRKWQMIAGQIVLHEKVSGLLIGFRGKPWEKPIGFLIAHDQKKIRKVFFGKRAQEQPVGFQLWGIFQYF